MVADKLDDDAIVISGISGKFPNSKNIDELIENLMNGVDCVTSNHSRWPKSKIIIVNFNSIYANIVNNDACFNVFFSFQNINKFRRVSG